MSSAAACPHQFLHPIPVQIHKLRDCGPVEGVLIGNWNVIFVGFPILPQITQNRQSKAHVQSLQEESKQKERPCFRAVLVSCLRDRILLDSIFCGTGGRGTGKQLVSLQRNRM